MRIPWGRRDKGRESAREAGGGEEEADIFRVESMGFGGSDRVPEAGESWR